MESMAIRISCFLGGGAALFDSEKVPGPVSMSPLISLEYLEKGTDANAMRGVISGSDETLIPR